MVAERCFVLLDDRREPIAVVTIIGGTADEAEKAAIEHFAEDAGVTVEDIEDSCFMVNVGGHPPKVML